MRMSLPLNRIADVKLSGRFPFVASLRVHTVLDERNGETDAAEPQTICLGTVVPDCVWTRLDKFITAAKHRSEKRSIEQFPVFIDFGPLNFEAQAPSEDDIPPTKEMRIRANLSLDSRESQLWSKIFLAFSTWLCPDHFGHFSHPIPNISKHIFVRLPGRISAFRLLLEQVIHAE